MQAARRYDPDKGSFRSFAFTRIKGAMIDALRRDFLLPRYARERGARLDRRLDRQADRRRRADAVGHARGRPRVASRRSSRTGSSSRARSRNEPTSRTLRTELTPMELEVLRGRSGRRDRRRDGRPPRQVASRRSGRSGARRSGGSAPGRSPTRSSSPATTSPPDLGRRRPEERLRRRGRPVDDRLRPSERIARSLVDESHGTPVSPSVRLIRRLACRQR